MNRDLQPDLDIDPAQLRLDLDAAALDRLRTGTFALMAWAVLTAILETIFFAEVRGQAIAFGLALLVLGIPGQIALRRGRFPVGWSEVYGALLLVLRMAHLGLAYYRTGSMFYPLLLINAMIAGAGVHLRRGPVIACLLLGALCWVPGLVANAHGDLVVGFVVVGGVCLVGLLFHVFRMRHFLYMHTMRTRDRRRGEELAAALASAERELRDRKHAEEERERLRDQLSHAQKMEAVGTLAGGFAHDLNNMLGVVIGLAEIVKDQVTGEVRDDVEQILSSCRRGSELTRNLLGFSRRGQYRIERIDMASVVREVSKLLSRTIPKSVTIDVQLDQGAHVVGDSTQLGQLLMNLCLNSVDAMADGGHLMLRVIRVDLDEEKAARAGVQPGPHVAMSVADSGCGMSEETRQRMFEPFFTTRRERGGTGLGLAMVYGTTMKHNGGIVVESASGAGTRITVYLPYASREDAARVTAASDDARRAETPAAADVLAAAAGEREPSPLISRQIAILGEPPLIEGGPRSAPISVLLSQVLPIMTDVPMVTGPARSPAEPTADAAAEIAGQPAAPQPPTPRPLPAPPSLPPPIAGEPADTTPMVAAEIASEPAASAPAPAAELSASAAAELSASAAAAPATLDAAPAAPTAAPAAPDAAAAARGNILIVDDEPMVRAVVRRTLRRAGYRVLEATDGMDGVEVFERHRSEIDLVVLDMAMPIMGGAACFSRLRELDPAARVILASGFAAEEDAQNCLQRGAICFLEKPYASAVLLAAIAGALEPGSPAARIPTGQIFARAAE